MARTLSAFLQVLTHIGLEVEYWGSRRWDFSPLDDDGCDKWEEEWEDEDEEVIDDDEEVMGRLGASSVTFQRANLVSLEPGTQQQHMVVTPNTHHDSTHYSPHVRCHTKHAPW